MHKSDRAYSVPQVLQFARRILQETSELASAAGWDSTEHAETARPFFQQMAE